MGGLGLLPVRGRDFESAGGASAGEVKSQIVIFAHSPTPATVTGGVHTPRPRRKSAAKAWRRPDRVGRHKIRQARQEAASRNLHIYSPEFTLGKNFLPGSPQTPCRGAALQHWSAGVRGSRVPGVSWLFAAIAAAPAAAFAAALAPAIAAAITTAAAAFRWPGGVQVGLRVPVGWAVRQFGGCQHVNIPSK